MGEFDFDVVTEKTCRRGAREEGVHRGESTAAPHHRRPRPLVYQRAAPRTRVRPPASLVCSAAPRVGRADRYTGSAEKGVVEEWSHYDYG